MASFCVYIPSTLIASFCLQKTVHVNLVPVHAVYVGSLVLVSGCAILASSDVTKKLKDAKIKLFFET